MNHELWALQHLDTGERRSSGEDQERVPSEAGGKARDLDVPEA